MNTTQAQQKALDDALVAPTDRLEFGKCNMRLKTDIKPKEVTFQVVLDALALTPFYQAFLITAEVPATYMQEFWATFSVHKEKALKPKYVQKKADSGTSPKKKTVQATKGTRIKSKAKVAKSDKKKQPSKVHDEQQQKVTGINEGAGVTPEVFDVPKYDSEIEEESWTFIQDDDEESDGLMQGKRRRKKGDDEAVSLIRECQPPDYESLNDEDVKRVMIRIRKHMEDTLLTSNKLVPRIEQQSSSVSSDLVSKFINPSPDTSIDSFLNQDTQSDTLVNVQVSVAAKTPSSVTTIPQPPIPNIQPLQQTPTCTTTTTNPIMTLPEIPNFASLF
ncbi:hypothetical protein Tco_1053516 [Tanacetum coccineum]|uniref:Uncharacterized protein n=1 Tax=Tanacetum coccineum TaxID=301880 RepID=A0ABQ5GV21_9ASTR